MPFISQKTSKNLNEYRGSTYPVEFYREKRLHPFRSRALMIYRFESKKYPSQFLKASLNTLCLSAASLGFSLYALNVLISFVSDL